MSEAMVRDAIVNELAGLNITTEGLRRILDFARSLHSSELQGIPGSTMATRTYGFEANDLDEMKKAIDRDCEKIDFHEW